MESGSPIIFHLQDGGLGKPVLQFQSKYKGLRTRGVANGLSPILKSKGQRNRSAEVQGQEKLDVLVEAKSSLVLSSTFCSIQAVNGLVDAYLHREVHLSVQFSCSVVSDSLRPHESQHARPPCPSPAPRVYSNSCPSSR